MPHCGNLNWNFNIVHTWGNLKKWGSNPVWNSLSIRQFELLRLELNMASSKVRIYVFIFTFRWFLYIGNKIMTWFYGNILFFHEKYDAWLLRGAHYPAAPPQAGPNQLLQKGSRSRFPVKIIELLMAEQDGLLFTAVIIYYQKKTLLRRARVFNPSLS